MNTKTTERTTCSVVATLLWPTFTARSQLLGLAWELSLYNDCAVDRELVSKHKFVGALVEVSKMTINVLIIVHRKFGLCQISVIG